VPQERWTAAKCHELIKAGPERLGIAESERAFDFNKGIAIQDAHNGQREKLSRRRLVTRTALVAPKRSEGGTAKLPAPTAVGSGELSLGIVSSLPDPIREETNRKIDSKDQQAPNKPGRPHGKKCGLLRS
jgi:hypothetical protein